MIELPGGYVIMADENQYIVGKPRQRPDKAGKQEERINPKYYTNLVGTLRQAIEQGERRKHD